MCGRYRLSRRKQKIEEHFDCVSGEEDWTPRYNVAPTQPVPIIRQHPIEPRRERSVIRWGLIPSWAKDASRAAGMINASGRVSGHQTRIPRCAEIPEIPHPCEWALRMVACRENQTARLLRGQRWRALCLRRTLGEMEGTEWQLVKSCSILTTTMFDSCDGRGH
jgi:SOS response associated peptidase (SRAP)